MTEKGSFRVSQYFAILEPKSGSAFPIPCEEWEHLKAKLRKVSSPPWGYQNAGSLLAGIGLATFASILVGNVPSPQHPNALVISWAIVAVALLGATGCYTFASKQRDMETVYVSGVIGDMEVIEHRFLADAAVSGHANLAASELVITDASYGSPEHRIDVTQQLNETIRDGMLRVYVGNQLAGDPCPNTPKNVVVKYTFRNEQKQKLAAEGDTLELP